MAVDRPFFRRPPPESLTRPTPAPGAEVKLSAADQEVADLLRRSAAVPGVGPVASRVLRLALDEHGYPRGDVLLLLRDHLTADELLDLEAVSLRRREEVGEVSNILRRQAEADAKRRPSK